MNKSRNMLKRWALFMLLVLSAAGIIFAEIELRQCPEAKCKKYALSDSWNYCPYCGTKLAEIKRDASEKNFAGNELVLGNMYKNKRFAFQIEKPNEKWKFVTGKKAKDFNGDATVVMTSDDDIYSMLIIEKMPDVSLEQYANLAEPELEDREKVYQQDAKINGLEAIKIKWSGKTSEVPFVFFYTLLKYGDYRVQIVSWMAAGNDNKALQVQISAIEDSFKALVDKTMPDKKPTEKPGDNNK